MKFFLFYFSTTADVEKTFGTAFFFQISMSGTVICGIIYQLTTVIKLFSCLMFVFKNTCWIDEHCSHIRVKKYPVLALEYQLPEMLIYISGTTKDKQILYSKTLKIQMLRVS